MYIYGVCAVMQLLYISCFLHGDLYTCKQSKANGSTQGRQLISKKKAELP